MKKFFVVASLCFFSGIVYAQNFKVLEHLNASVGVGSSGFAIEAGTPVTDWLDVRAGFTFTPTIKAKMGFGVQVGEGEDPKFDANGNPRETKFDQMKGYLEEITGFSVDDVVDMNCTGSMAHARVMFDFKPLPNKDWHVTAGFYWGTKKIGKAVNSLEDMSTTMAVGIYNTMYEKVYNFEPIFGGIYLPSDYEDKLIRNGKMGMHVGSFKHDMTDANGVEHKAGESYMMVPAEDGTVKANAKVNSFKPYLGLGWSHAFTEQWSVGVDAGVIFWGGVPNITTHEGVSLTHDVKDLHGKVGDVISTVKSFPVLPLLEAKISYVIF